MSGTSADGVDAALVRMDDGPLVELVAYHVRPYDEEERGALRGAIERGGGRELSHLNFDMAGWFTDAVEAVLVKGGAAPEQLDFIASHGHTVWHEPGKNTLQLGEAAVLAERFGVSVISDFRVRDVAAGGQGAPLVPLVDVDLFSGSGERVLLNIGGIANVTWIPAPPDRTTAVAFDTGPGMTLIDTIVREQFHGMSIDDDGALAASGTVDQVAVETLLGDSYFRKPPPKSTGREFFGDAYARSLCSRVREHHPGATAHDFLATSVELTARSISDHLATLDGNPRDLVISGGGARNSTLVNRLRVLNSRIEVKLFDELYFDGDAKEAVAFAYLGWLTTRKSEGNLPGVTGSAGPRVLGKITPA